MLPEDYDSLVDGSAYTELRAEIKKAGLNAVVHPIYKSTQNTWFTAKRFINVSPFLDMLGGMNSTSIKPSQGYACKLSLVRVEFYINYKQGCTKQKYLYVQYVYKLAGDGIPNELYQEVVSRFKQAESLAQKEESQESTQSKSSDFTLKTKVPLADLQGLSVDPYIDKSDVTVLLTERVNSNKDYTEQSYTIVPGRVHETQGGMS